MSDALQKHYDTHHTLVDREVLILYSIYNSGINIIQKFGLGEEVDLINQLMHLHLHHIEDQHLIQRKMLQFVQIAQHQDLVCIIHRMRQIYQSQYFNK